MAVRLIDYKKVYDMVPHSCIVECLDLVGVAENLRTLSVVSKWRVMLCGKIGVRGI